jgi:cytochrome c oxidase subunit 2
MPRRYTYVWFEATKPGTYRLYCTEYCGRDHSQMKVNVVVHEPGGYERYLSEADASSQVASAENGAKLYEKKGVYRLPLARRFTPDRPVVQGHLRLDHRAQGRHQRGRRRELPARRHPQPAGAGPAGVPAVSMPAFEGQLKESELMSLILFIKAQK